MRRLSANVVLAGLLASFSSFAWAQNVKGINCDQSIWGSESSLTFVLWNDEYFLDVHDLNNGDRYRAVLPKDSCTFGTERLGLVKCENRRPTQILAGTQVYNVEFIQFEMKYGKIINTYPPTQEEYPYHHYRFVTLNMGSADTDEGTQFKYKDAFQVHGSLAYEVTCFQDGKKIEGI